MNFKRGVYMDFRTKLIAAAVVVVGIFILYWNMNREIAIRDDIINQLNNKVSEKETLIISKDNNINDLKLSIAEANVKVYETSVSNQKLLQEVDEWKNKPAEVKYVNKEVIKIINTKEGNDLCAYGLELNRQIGELKYEDIK